MITKERIIREIVSDFRTGNIFENSLTWYFRRNFSGLFENVPFRKILDTAVILNIMTQDDLDTGRKVEAFRKQNLEEQYQ